MEKWSKGPSTISRSTIFVFHKNYCAAVQLAFQLLNDDFMDIHFSMKYLTFFFLFSVVSKAGAQFHQPVFPSLAGQPLLDSLRSAYKPNTLLPEAPARDTLFSVIYGQNDSLTCVYTGYTIWLDPAKDPTVAAFDKGLNTEHTFPQSYFADMSVGKGDMHHLYATRADVNGDRANLPFAEIPDNQTQQWYYLDTKQSTIPTSNINLYSEKKNDGFEPREDHKGNVARAMFYFFTMYKGQPDFADAAFFESQRATLCAWHLLDPVDAKEWERTWLIANYQDGKPNPFVLDCTLPQRCYCAEFGEICEPVSAGKTREKKPFTVQVKPNPASEGTLFSYILPQPGNVRIEIFNLAGRQVEKLELGNQDNGDHTFFWEKPAGLGAGLFFYRLSLVFDNQPTIMAPGKLLLID